MRRLFTALLCATLLILISATPAEPSPRPGAAEFVFAYDTTAKAVIKVPTAGGPAVTVADGWGTIHPRFAADRWGTVWIADTEAGVLYRVRAGDSTKTVVRSGFSELKDVQVDAYGRAYVLDGKQIVRFNSRGSSATTIGQAPGYEGTRYGMSVNRQGDVTLVSDTGNLVIFPARGELTTRQLDRPGNRVSALLSDNVGNVYVKWNAGGATGYEAWYKYAPAATDGVEAGTRMAKFLATVAPSNEFVLLETVNWCIPFEEQSGDCVPDRSVPNVRRTTPAGNATTVAIEGLKLGVGYSGVVVDRNKNLYVAQTEGPSAGLWKYSADGGAPTVLASGTFTAPDIGQ